MTDIVIFTVDKYDFTFPPQEIAAVIVACCISFILGYVLKGNPNG